MRPIGFLAISGPPQLLSAYLRSITPPPGTRTQLNRVHDSPDLVAFATPETPVVDLGTRQGVIIGPTFGTVSPYGRKPAFSEDEIEAVRHSNGRILPTLIWGRYVAFLRSVDGSAVIRDPSATLPVHHMRIGALHLHFSGLDMLEDLGLSAPEVDVAFVRQWLTFPQLRTVRTGLAGIVEVAPGGRQMLHRHGGVTLDQIWTPWNHIGVRPAFADMVAARDALRTVVLESVAAQVGGLDDLALELSGGLDSSIVAASIAAAGVAFKAANFATQLPDGDERSYARSVARHVGVELLELEEDALSLEFPIPAPSLRPRLSALLQPVRNALGGLTRLGVGTFATGAAGDNLFCYISTTAPILDAAHDMGLRYAARRTLVDVANLTDSTAWTAAIYAIRKHRRGPSPQRWRADTTFLTEAAIAGDADLHPWLDRPACAPAGKREHVDSLVRVQHFLDQDYPAGTTPLHVLINQPLLELCLSIPTWLWVEGGVNRAVARQAFKDLLPPDIIHRRTKGRLESMCARNFEASRPAIKPILLDGALAARGLIDLPLLSAYLDETGRVSGDAYYRVLDLVSMELWLRSWGD